MGGAEGSHPTQEEGKVSGVEGVERQVVGWGEGCHPTREEGKVSGVEGVEDKLWDGERVVTQLKRKVKYQGLREWKTSCGMGRGLSPNSRGR